MSMEQPQPYESPQGVPPPPPRPGMSAGTKVLLILGIIFLVLIVVCCGGALLLGVWGQRYFARSLSEDPQVIRQVTAEIAQIDVPETMRPAFSMDMRVPFTEQRMVTMAAYADRQTESILMLASFGEAMGPQNREQLRAQMRQALREQGLGQEETAGPRDIEERQIVVRGQPETFTFVRSEDAETGRPRLEVSGTFPSDNGVTLFQFYGDAEKYSEEEVVRIIESIR